MTTIKMINDRWGWPALETGATEEEAVYALEQGIRTCGPEFAESLDHEGGLVEGTDYEVVPDGTTLDGCGRTILPE
ncbi:MAG: hypothetical protein C0436_04130 [Alphaproteobacteria bacterium]|nr:hypothetical protein [Alphaproteobacteria bacterium]